MGIALAYMKFSELGKFPSRTSDLKPADIDVSPKAKVIPKGCKVFIIEGKEIIAINEKSAKRKFLKTK